ncbi:MAG TPA: ABC transporter ATP-binding protein [Candidatus Saccharimonadales bacterium]|nr:ABC transporter ATP-binding protein [Candidatus Saccharimonadales bacterium]
MRTMAPPVLRVTDARKSFGSIPALDGASLELHPGQLMALLGPNGAGKTTLVRAIAGRVRLDGGTIELFGQPVNGSLDRAALGVVPQEVAIYPLLTARENLELFAHLHGVPRAQVKRRVDWALDWTGLGERAREPSRRFSGGMRRRLNLACGVMHEPRLVLLDEPTVGVDPQSRERIYEMLVGLRTAGASLLLTTHQLEEAEARCDPIVILDHGRAIAAGTLAELVARTVGGRRTVTFALETPPAAPVAGLSGEPDAPVLRGELGDVAAELPAMLARVEAAGCRVRDIEVRGPSLQAVFLHLTGRELRE